MRPSQSLPTPFPAGRLFLAAVAAGTRRWWSKAPGTFGAALAYYSIFSLGPILLILVATAGLLIGQTNAEAALSSYLGRTMGADVASVATRMLTAAGRFGSGWKAMAGGFAAFAVGLASLVLQLRSALDQMLDAGPAAPTTTLRSVCSYALSIATVLGAGLLFAAAVAASTAIATLTSDAPQLLPSLAVHVFGLIVSIVIVTGVFAGLFKWVPDMKIEWRDALLGGAVTAVLFEIGTSAIGWYLGRQAYGSVYGASAAFVVLLAWIYYVSQIVFFGAAFTRSWITLKGEASSERS